MKKEAPRPQIYLIQEPKTKEIKLKSKSESNYDILLITSY